MPDPTAVCTSANTAPQIPTFFLDYRGNESGFLRDKKIEEDRDRSLEGLVGEGE